MKCMAVMTVMMILLAAGASQAAMCDGAVVVTRDRSGQRVAVRVGETLRIELPALGGAGYVWHPDTVGDGVELATAGALPVTAHRMTGAPVVEIWCARAVRAGETAVKLDLYREWEGRERAVDSFSIILQITDGTGRTL